MVHNPRRQLFTLTETQNVLGKPSGRAERRLYNPQSVQKRRAEETLRRKILRLYNPQSVQPEAFNSQSDQPERAEGTLAVVHTKFPSNDRLGF